VTTEVSVLTLTVVAVVIKVVDTVVIDTDGELDVTKKVVVAGRSAIDDAVLAGAATLGCVCYCVSQIADEKVPFLHLRE